MQEKDEKERKSGQGMVVNRREDRPGKKTHGEIKAKISKGRNGGRMSPAGRDEKGK
jgi:hypothetical protein